MRGRKLRKQLRRLGVVAPPLLGVHLDHRHVLVGGGVQHDFGLLGREKRVHFAAVVHVVHQRHAARIVHPAVDLVERVFAALHHKNPLRARSRHLADYLGPDRSARASHHHRLPGEESPRDRVVEMLDVPLKELVLANAARPVDAPKDANAHDANRSEEEGDHGDGVRRADVGERDIGKEVAHQREDAAREHHRANVLRKLAPAYPAPCKAVAPEDEERDEMYRAHYDIRARDRGPSTERRRLLKIKPKRKRAEIREADYGGIDGHPDDARREKPEPRLAGTRHFRSQAP